MNNTPALPVKPENTSVPQALPLEATTETYTLYYIQGGNHNVKQKNFVFTGDKSSAISRGRQHCEILNLRFIRVEPFFSSLEADEKRHQQ